VVSKHEPAILVKGRRFIYSEYDQYVAATAERLKAAGVAPGDRIALLVADPWQLAVLMMAIFRAGGVAFPLAPDMEAGELERMLREAACRCIISDEGARVPGGMTAHRPDELVAFFSEKMPEEASAQIPLAEPAAVFAVREPEGPAARLVVHTYGSLYYGAKAFNHAIRSSSGSRWLLTSPLWTRQGFATAFRCALGGAALVLADKRQKVADAVEEFGVTHLATAREALEEMLGGERGEDELETLRTVVLEESSVARDLVDRGKLWGIRVCCGFGVPEMGPYVTLNLPDAAPDRRQGAGPVLKYAEVGTTGDGRVMVRGEMLFKGYLRGGTLERVLDADGWFDTGRKGFVDGAGCVTISG